MVSAKKAAAPVSGWVPQISSAAVKVKTGKGWNEWLAILDRANAAKLGHTAIAELLNRKFGVPGWWSQMVTVGYEQARGLRVKHQKPEGFEISVTRVIETDVKSIFKAWTDAKSRARWMPKTALTVHKSTPNKSLRITWTDGGKSVSVNFYPKGARKTQVAVQHGKLPSAAAAAKMKKFWGGRLDALRKLVAKP